MFANLCFLGAGIAIGYFLPGNVKTAYEWVAAKFKKEE